MLKYIHEGAIPCAIAFCSSKKSLNKELKKNGVEKTPFIIDGSVATVHSFINTDDFPVSIICADIKQLGEFTSSKIAGIIAHEAMHVVDNIIIQMHEEVPGKEFKAYLIQYITMYAMQFFLTEIR